MLLKMTSWMPGWIRGIFADAVLWRRLSRRFKRTFRVVFNWNLRGMIERPVVCIVGPLDFWAGDPAGFPDSCPVPRLLAPLLSSLSVAELTHLFFRQFFSNHLTCCFLLFSYRVSSFFFEDQWLGCTVSILVCGHVQEVRDRGPSLAHGLCIWVSAVFLFCPVSQLRTRDKKRFQVMAREP